MHHFRNYFTWLVCYTDYDDLKQPFNSTVTVKIGEYRTADKTLACLLFEFSVNTTETIVNKKCGRRVRPTRYAPAPVVMSDPGTAFFPELR